MSNSKRTIAYHEAGHVLLAVLAKKEIDGVFIIKSSQQFGVTYVFVFSEIARMLDLISTQPDGYFRYCKERVQFYLAGNAAQHLLSTKDTDDQSSESDFSSAQKWIKNSEGHTPIDEATLQFLNCYEETYELLSRKENKKILRRIARELVRKTRHQEGLSNEEIADIFRSTQYKTA